MASEMQELEHFVREALVRGLPRPQIASALREAGWSESQAGEALDAYVTGDFPLPVPRPRVSVSARDAFFYLVLFSALYVSAYHLGSLAFEFIDRALPDPAQPQPGWAVIDAMRLSSASLIIALPLFLLMSRRIGSAMARSAAMGLSPVRRWLTYLTLFLAAAILVGDLITLVYDALGGALSARFCLKVLVVALIAGGIFTHYLTDLAGRTRYLPALPPRVLGVAFGALALLAVTGSLILEPPALQRQMKEDTRRERDLAAIQSAVGEYWKRHAALPSDLAQLGAEPGFRIAATDPQSGLPYGYSVTGNHNYQLCAQFALDSRQGPRSVAQPAEVGWVHVAGRQCFELAVRELKP